MNALGNKPIKQAYFISPMVNLEKLICNMMIGWESPKMNFTKRKLCRRISARRFRGNTCATCVKIPSSGASPRRFLYGSNDNLTSLETMREFAQKIGAPLTVMDGGEHWFHTAEQMAFLDKWIRE
jgi:hypothetical protein